MYTIAMKLGSIALSPAVLAGAAVGVRDGALPVQLALVLLVLACLGGAAEECLE